MYSARSEVLTAVLMKIEVSGIRRYVDWQIVTGVS
jgi:hypothetical protein